MESDDAYVLRLQESIRSVKENREMISECLQELAGEGTSIALFDELKARITSVTDLNLLKR